MVGYAVEEQDTRMVAAGRSVRLGDVVPEEPGRIAWACTRMGWRVFPLVPRSGLPAIRDWPNRATADESTIEEWWSWSFPNHGVGVVTGKVSGIWVLDLDVKKGLDGPQELVNIVQREHVDEQPPDTFTVRTRSGGTHLYFAWPEGENELVRNSTGVIAPGIDVRGDRGYVRAPLRTNDVISSTRPVAAPRWLLEKALNAKRYRSDERSGPWTRDTSVDAIEVALRAGRKLGAVASGSRNDALNRAAFLLGRWSHETGVTVTQAQTALQEGCRRNGLYDEDGPEAFHATFASGWNAGFEAAERERRAGG
jgi:bifunctional DNA primase/polymerase-like protein